MQIEINPDFKPHWIEGLADEHYHADKTAVSSSSLKLMLKSPATFKARFIDGLAKPETPAMIFGRLAHRAVLEGTDFLKSYCVMPDFGDMRSSKNRDRRAGWLADLPPGSTVVTEKELDQIHGIVNSILRHPDAFNIFKSGVTEISGYYADPVTGIKCRIRPDFLSYDLGALVDFKTTVDCTDEEFAKTIWNYRYDFQLAMYSEGTRLIAGMEVKFAAFVACEKEPPYECAVFVADDALLDFGKKDYRRALDRLKTSIDKGEWSGYQTGIQNISLPYWAFNK